MIPTDLSGRANKILSSNSPLVEAYFKCREEPFDELHHPEGYIDLGTSENHLIRDLLQDKLKAIDSLSRSPITYQEGFGNLAVRTAVADFYQTFTGGSIDPAEVLLSSGASASIEMLTFALCDPGDVILVPAPYYSGFHSDVTARAQVSLEPIPMASQNGFRITSEELEMGYQTIASKYGKSKIKAILLSSPSNPLGISYDKSELVHILDFADQANLHCIVDELYAGSVYGGNPFISAWSLPMKRPDRVHIVYGFAKDFGLSGFRIGALFSKNKKLVSVLQSLSQLAPISSVLQTVVIDLLKDESWRQSLFEINHQRLSSTSQQVGQFLENNQIPFVKADAGLFLWINLSKYLVSPDFKSELVLYQSIFKNARVNFSPGKLFSSQEPGWFRLCFSRQEAPLKTGLKRIVDYLSSQTL
jgi:aspartate/methionine/tyrosine aminotransferase